MSEIINKYYEKLLNYEEQLMDDLAELVAIRSVRDEDTITSTAPFGEGVHDVFEKILSIADRDQFTYANFDGYAVHIEHGQGQEIVGVLAHLDIVPEGDRADWLFDPFTLTKHEGQLIGRGVNDDKAPALAAYYALKILRDLNFEFDKKVRIILGGAEETTWECMDYYFKHNPQPNVAFSPDGDFPIVNGEKGVIQGTLFTQVARTLTSEKNKIISIESAYQRGFICEDLKVVFQSENLFDMVKQLRGAEKVDVSGGNVTAFYKGDKTLSRNPHKGQNAIFKFIRDLNHLDDLNESAKSVQSILNRYLLDDVYGQKLAMFSKDQEMGVTTLSFPYLQFNGNDLEIAFDYRFPKGQTVAQAEKRLRAFTNENNMRVDIHKVYEPLFVEQDSHLIKTLQAAYKKVTGEKAECITKGGISYARALDNCVAFGPTFPNDSPNTHKPNENIKIETLNKAIIIYCEVIRQLATK